MFCSHLIKRSRSEYKGGCKNKVNAGKEVKRFRVCKEEYEFTINAEKHRKVCHFFYSHDRDLKGFFAYISEAEVTSAMMIH